jgi:hypothetical protein
VSWGTGLGDVAGTVAELDAAVSGDQVQRLAYELTGLSAVVWRTFTHPATAAESLETNTEGWRREGTREAFTLMPEALVNPNLPQNGSITVSYISTEEAAHWVGRALHAIGDAKLTERVVGEVNAELAAVEQAELGDLSGRARQAVMLTRAGASPAQVEAADRLLHDHPLGTDKLFSDIDPTAAAVAAAHWLLAAAEVASDESGVAPTQAVVEADSIGALPHETPTLLLERMIGGATPYQAVTGLVRDAMAAAEGEIPDIESIPERIAKAEETARHYGRDDPRVREEMLRSIRTTPLDPMRPARDLLEDLLSGIEGCWMLYREHAYDTAEEDDVDDLSDFQDENDEDDDTNEETSEQFIELVRLEAADSRERLL